MAAQGPVLGSGGKIKGVGNSGQNRAKATPKVLAKPNTIKSTPAHQKARKVSR